MKKILTISMGALLLAASLNASAWWGNNGYGNNGWGNDGWGDGWGSGDAAGAGIILSWFFTTGYKLVVPIIALVWILIGRFRQRIRDTHEQRWQSRRDP